MKTVLLIFSAFLSLNAYAQPMTITTVPCNDSMIYQNPFVYGGRLPKACAVTSLSPQTTAARRTVLGYAKYGICDYDALSRRATQRAWEKCGRPSKGVIRTSDWQFECLDHAYGSDLGSTAVAAFACL